jgi:uncharacterized membrane protein YfcA
VTLETIAPAALIVIAGYTVFGLTGFGASVVAMPLLAHLMPLRTAVPMMLLFDLVAASFVGLRNRRVVELRELLRLAPFMMVGIVVGVFALVRAPERLLLASLGVFVLGYAAFVLLARPTRAPIAAAWAAPLGVVGGVFTALFGTGGPLYTVYLARRIADTRGLRATLSSLILVGGIVRVTLFAGVGLYAQPDVLKLGAVLFPCAMLGLYIGSRTHARLPARRMVQLVWAVLVIAGATLLWRSARGT